MKSIATQNRTRAIFMTQWYILTVHVMPLDLLIIILISIQSFCNLIVSWPSSLLVQVACKGQKTLQASNNTHTKPAHCIVLSFYLLQNE